LLFFGSDDMLQYYFAVSTVVGRMMSLVSVAGAGAGVMRAVACTNKSVIHGALCLNHNQESGLQQQQQHRQYRTM
jgi:hypothetical protein